MKNQEKIVAKTKELLSGYCAPELKAAAEAWLKAAETGDAKEEAQAYVAELEDAVMDIDSVIAAFSDPGMAEAFGAERAAQIRDHAKDVKAAGGKWCDCPACTKGLELLSYKEDLLDHIVC